MKYLQENDTPSSEKLGVFIETRDAVVKLTALRLGKLHDFTPPKNPHRWFCAGVVPDENLLHLIMRFAGFGAAADDGWAMISIPAVPGAETALRAMALANFFTLPKVKTRDPKGGLS